MPEKPSRQVVTFLVLTLAFCLPLYTVIISAGSITAVGDLVVLGIMWGPGLAALLTRFFYQRNLRGFGWRAGARRFLVLSYLVPLAAGLIVYGTVWATGLGGFAAERMTREAAQPVGLASFLFWRSVFIAATIELLPQSVFALGEELGWRGLLVPELAKIFPFGKTALLSGIIWTAYHLPLLLFAGYHSAAPVWYGLLFFSVTAVAVSFILAWLRLKSGSVWPAVIAHASHNLFIQDVFDRLTVSHKWTQYLTTEFGLGLAIVYVAVAWVCWRRRGELPT